MPLRLFRSNPARRDRRRSPTPRQYRQWRRRRRWCWLLAATGAFTLLAWADRTGLWSARQSDVARFDGLVVRVERVTDAATLVVRPLNTRLARGQTDAHSKSGVRVRLLGVAPPSASPPVASPTAAPPAVAPAVASRDAPFPTRARRHLSRLVRGRRVVLHLERRWTRDQAGRLLAFVTVPPPTATVAPNSSTRNSSTRNSSTRNSSTRNNSTRTACTPAAGRTTGNALPAGVVLNEQLLVEGWVGLDATRPHARIHRFRLLERQARRKQRGLWQPPASPLRPP